jgi:LacI family transcriptional regulator
VSTISRALNDSPRVEESTKTRVKDIARKLGYQKNDIARSLVTKQSRVIGLIVSAINNPFFAEIAMGAEKEAMRRGYSTILCNSGWDAEREREYLRVLKSRQVDGIIVHLSEELSARSLQEFQEGSTPVVFIGNAFDTGDPYFVSIDNFKGAVEATAYLVSLGHRNIAHITGDTRNTQKGYRIMMDRLEGYRAALKQAGIRYRESLVVESFHTVESVREEFREMLRRRPEVTAVFAMSDIMAMGVYKAVHDLGLSIPHDVSVVGFDDIVMASVLQPGLTTYEQPKFQQGKLAVTILSRILGGCPPKKRDFIVKSRGLIVRESCAPPRRASR